VLAHKLLSIDYLEQSIDFKKKIYIAFSGGIDSSVLVDILGKNVSKYNLDITVIHINHNISVMSRLYFDTFFPKISTNTDESIPPLNAI
jgi:predicted phosphoadenosine phosphosulfate sulfurtransferase